MITRVAELQANLWSIPFGVVIGPFTIVSNVTKVILNTMEMRHLYPKISTWDRSQTFKQLFSNTYDAPIGSRWHKDSIDKALPIQGDLNADFLLEIRNMLDESESICSTNLKTLRDEIHFVSTTEVKTILDLEEELEKLIKEKPYIFRGSQKTICERHIHANREIRAQRAEINQLINRFINLNSNERLLFCYDYSAKKLKHHLKFIGIGFIRTIPIIGGLFCTIVNTQNRNYSLYRKYSLKEIAV